MIPFWLGLAALLPLARGTQSADSTAFLLGLAPADSIQVTAVGPPHGPAVVIVPGLVSPAYAFRHLFPSLTAAGMRTVVVEPLGVGHSSRPREGDYSHTAQAARVAAAMDRLGVQHAVVMGHAVGAAVALRLALMRPDLVRGMVLVEGGALEAAAVPGVKKALKFAFLVRIFAGRGRIRKEVRKGLVASSGDTTWVTDSVIEHYTEGPAGDVGAVLRALKGMEEAVEPDSLTPRLGRIHVPVRLLVGGAAHQGGITPGRIRGLAQGLPHFIEITVPGAGLHIHEERPDVVVREILHLAEERSP